MFVHLHKRAQTQILLNAFGLLVNIIPPLPRRERTHVTTSCRDTRSSPYASYGFVVCLLYLCFTLEKIAEFKPPLPHVHASQKCHCLLARHHLPPSANCPVIIIKGDLIWYLPDNSTPTHLHEDAKLLLFDALTAPGCSKELFLTTMKQTCRKRVLLFPRPECKSAMSTRCLRSA